MPIVHSYGDLLDMQDKVDALVNPVNCVGVSGAGLAREFAVQFPVNQRHYVNACRSMRIRPGQVFAAHDYRPNGLSIVIINFPTKLQWHKPSTTKWIEEGLDSLVGFLRETPEINTLAMPALGCGLGGLRWPVVKELITTKMNTLPVQTFLFGPQ